ncbi:MAG: heterodisulfide reductase-related iron-sulfur binding cluster [Anaerolineae bacterium]
MASETLPLDTKTPDSPWLKRLAGAWPGLRDFFVHAVGQVRVLRKAYPGVMHFLIFWGMTIQIVGTAINLMQMQLFIPFVELQFPRGNGYLAYELIMDLAGAAIIIGALMAAFRRGVLRPGTLKTRWDDIYAIGLLLLIPLIGFVTEGLRILAIAPEWAAWSPIGSWTAALFSTLGMTPAAAWNLHPVFYWGHMIAGLVFVASIPFTKLRHLVTGPLNVILRSRRPRGELSTIENIEETEQLGVGHVAEFTSSQLLSFDACVSCGRCTENCPAYNSGMPFAPRDLIQSLREVMVASLVKPNGSGHKEADLTEMLGEEIAWYCTTCGACLAQCPMFIDPIAEVIDLRRYQALTTGKVPGSVGLALRNVERQNNPWGLPAGDRMAWADGLDLPVLEPGQETDVLLFMGCAMAYDERNQKVARAFIEVLRASGVDFAVLGEMEACCGETARRLGHEYLFQMLAQQNIETLGELRFKRIVTQCPHCFNTLKNEYPHFGGEYQVLHYTELLAEIAPQIALAAPDGTEPERMTYHDPCYLGRHNQVYEEPRRLLDAAGVRRVEMDRRREQAFCCGGGGGGMWVETDAETRINHRRLTDALDTGAGVVATACPYCLLMFDDAIRSQGVADRVQVMDIAEVLASRLSAHPDPVAAGGGDGSKETAHDS